MKKLMFAMAAVAAGVAFADDIVSANVVGYQQIAVLEGFSAFTPTFKNVTEAEYSMDDILVVDGDSYAGQVYLQVMDDQGDYGESFTYWGSTLGWFSDTAAEKPTLKPGQSLCVNNVTGSTIYFQVSGEVALENKNMIPVDLYLWGNATPVDVDLNDVKVVDVDGEINDAVAGNVFFQLIDESGSGDYGDTFTYWGSDIGWYSDVIEVPTLAPGQCGCVNNTTGDTVYFKVPSPLE